MYICHWHPLVDPKEFQNRDLIALHDLSFSPEFIIYTLKKLYFHFKNFTLIFKIFCYQLDARRTLS